MNNVDAEQIIAEIKSYETELAGILSRFTRDRDGIYIDCCSDIDRHSKHRDIFFPYIYKSMLDSRYR